MEIIRGADLVFALTLNREGKRPAMEGTSTMSELPSRRKILFTVSSLLILSVFVIINYRRLDELIFPQIRAYPAAGRENEF